MTTTRASRSFSSPSIQEAMEADEAALEQQQQLEEKAKTSEQSPATKKRALQSQQPPTKKKQQEMKRQKMQQEKQQEAKKCTSKHTMTTTSTKLTMTPWIAQWAKEKITPSQLNSVLGRSSLDISEQEERITTSFTLAQQKTGGIIVTLGKLLDPKNTNVLKLHVGGVPL